MSHSSDHSDFSNSVFSSYLVQDCSESEYSVENELVVTVVNASLLATLLLVQQFKYVIRLKTDPQSSPDKVLTCVGVMQDVQTTCRYRGSTVTVDGNISFSKIVCGMLYERQISFFLSCQISFFLIQWLEFCFHMSRELWRNVNYCSQGQIWMPENKKTNKQTQNYLFQ